MPRVKRVVKEKGKIKVTKQSILKRHSGKGGARRYLPHPESQLLESKIQNKGDSGVVSLPRMTKTQRTTDNDLALEFYDTKGKVVETIELPKEIFGAKVNNQLMAQSVRVYLANQRRGTASTKTRGEVSGSTRKIWAQKHTGRARHGSRKAPIFVGGGIVSGPHPRDFSLKLSKKMKRLALFSTLTSKFQKGEIKGITGFEKIEPKTKLMVMALENLGISDKDKKILLVIPSSEKDFENVSRASRNIKSINILNAGMLNAYEILNNKLVLLVKESLQVMKDRFLKK
jgi:large subunit ribosomal protein L4